MDLARLMRHLAGDKGTYILSKAAGSPSATTIKRRSKPLAIIPCAAAPTAEELICNLNLVFPCAELEEAPMLSGYILMADSLAIERAITWIQETDEMAGACREHSPPSRNLQSQDVALRECPRTRRSHGRGLPKDPPRK